MQHTISTSGRPTTRESSARGLRPVEPVQSETIRSDPAQSQSRSQMVRVADSPAASGFSVAGILTAALAITAAALLYHGAGSNVVFAAAFGCLAAAALLQIVARRRLREELIKDAREHGAADPEADVKRNMDCWLEHR